MTLPRRLAAGAVAVLLTAALGGCAPDAGEPPSAIARGAAKSREALGASSGTGGPAVIELTADTFVDVVAGAQVPPTAFAFTMVTATPDGTLRTTGKVRIDAPGDLDLLIRSSSPAGTEEARLVDGTVYWRASGLTGEKFLVVDRGQAGLEHVGTEYDPAGRVGDLAGAIVAVRRVGGTELVSGVPTQQYDVTIELDEVTGQWREQIDMFGPGLGERATFGYWVCADGLVRQMTYGLADVTVWTQYSGWGEPVDIAAPAPEDLLQ